MCGSIQQSVTPKECLVPGLLYHLVLKPKKEKKKKEKKKEKPDLQLLGEKDRL